MIYLTETYNSNPILFMSFVFFIGTVLASFGGVVASRLPYQYGWLENNTGFDTYNIVKPDSHCNSCKRKLKFHELIPVLGWFFSKGKCSQCKGKIPFMYPLSEFLMGVLFVKSVFVWGVSLEAVLFMLACWVSYVISVIDWETTWIPEMFTTSMMWIGIITYSFTGGVFSNIYGAVFGWLFFSITFYVVSIIKKMDIYAGGDVAFAAMVGAWIGIERIFEYLFISSIVFIIIASFYRRKGEIWVPMGPSLAFAFILELLMIGYNVYLFPKIIF